MARLDERGRNQGLALATYGERLGFERGLRPIPPPPPLLLPFQRNRRNRRIGLIISCRTTTVSGGAYWARLAHHGWRIPSLPLRVAPTWVGRCRRDSDIENQLARPAAIARQRVVLRCVFSISTASIRSGRRDEFRGKVLIIGATAIGRNDLHPTPLAQQQTGPKSLPPHWRPSSTRRAGSAAALVRVLIGLLPCSCWGWPTCAASACFHWAWPWRFSAPCPCCSPTAPCRKGWLVRVVAPLASLWVAYLALGLGEYLRERRTGATMRCGYSAASSIRTW